ncbi:MAG: hypothetical protein EXR70_12510 [Deltaproteobacteria bacterium]|nr:hypothetical protein [Deltaproteobacteria bacterium]
MFAELYKSRRLLLAAALPPLLVLLWFGFNGWQRRAGVSDSPSETVATVSLQEMRQSLVNDRQLLADYEKEQAMLRAEVIRRRKLFAEGQLAKDQVLEAEQKFVAALKRVHAMRYTVTETDIAITEAVLGEKVLRMPALPVGGFSQTAELTRFNGPFKWSIGEAPRVQKFFSNTFGRSLPITALGQSDTHNRFGFDHRDSVDVGLHPDSAEGRQLIDYLRKSGIPFLAFRQAVPGAATGPHIHIGKPSAFLRH